MTDVHIGVLLPARLETRFVEPAGLDQQGHPIKNWRLKIAVIPDEPWMNRHSEVVSAAEAARVAALWGVCQHDPAMLRTTEEGRAAFARLAQEVGAARAWWLVTHFGPDDAIEAGQKRLSRMDSLPEQIEIWLGVRQDQGIDLQRLEPPMTVNKAALPFDAADAAAFSLFTNGRWWTQDAGLQAEYQLPFTDEDQLRQIEVIMAIGLSDERPQDLFESHRNAGALSLLPLGAATNTVSGAPAADLAQDPETWWRLLSQPGEAATREDIALALAGDAAALDAIPGGTRGHRALNQDLMSLLWPALWGHTLKDVWCVDHALDWRGFSFELGLWARDFVQPEGPLAPVRIREQPYGIWPVTRLSDGAWQAAAGDPPVERAWLAQWLPRARRQWAAGAAARSGTVAGADTDTFVRLLGRVPSGSDYGYRTFLPLQMSYLLARSALGPDRVKERDTWRDMAREQVETASRDLAFPVRPIRRYMTWGWRQDLLLPLVEPPPMTDAEAQAVKEGGSAFFAQVERLFEIDRDGPGISKLFLWNIDLCEPLLQTDSLLMRLILNSIALLHAEMGRMRESLDFEGLPLVERFDPGGFCTDLQMWCGSASELSFDRLLDDGAVCDFFGLGLDCLDRVGQWPIVSLYRNLIGTLQAWLGAYAAALTRVRNGEAQAVQQLLADVERAFRATLDTAAVRIDPWITGMAWRRLQQLRREGRGDGLGLYAWVDRPYTGTPGPTAGGTLLAPSHAQLLTSVILRDKQINDPQADRWRIELDSRKVRLAKRFADEVRAGAHIQEVLGRAVEGIVGRDDQIKQLREQFPIRKEHAGRRVCDGQEVLRTGQAFLNGLGLSLDQQAALDELRQVVDTYGDLLVANAVHAVVSGRPEKAGETMEAAAGLELAPEFDVLRTPRSGDSVTTTVWMALPVVDQPPDASDPDVSPALLADASVASFLERSVPASQWRWRVRRGSAIRTVTLAGLGLSVPEALAYSEDELRQLAIRHVNGTGVIERTAGGVPSSPAVPAYRRLRRLATLLAGHLRDVHNVRDDAGAELWAQHDGELRTRLDALLVAAQTLSAALAPDLADRDALRRARRWGIAPAPLDDALAPVELRLTAEEQLKHQLAQAQQTLQARLERAQALGSGAPVHQVVQAISDLSGSALPIYGRAARSMLEDSGPLAPIASLDRDWLETMAAVRPALAKIEAHQLQPEPGLAAFGNHADPWTFVKPDANARVKQPMNVVVCYSPSAALDDTLAVAVLDSWSEMIPAKRHVVEAAFGFNAPSSRAPQAILLAVPPDEAQPLDTEMLAHIVLDARESAHARMTTPDDIPAYAALFPFAMIPSRQPTGVSMQPVEPV